MLMAIFNNAVLTAVFNDVFKPKSMAIWPYNYGLMTL